MAKAPNCVPAASTPRLAVSAARLLVVRALRAVVRALVAELFAEGIEATVSTTVRETVDAVAALKKDEVSLGELAAKLALDKSVTSRRLRQATEFGYLVNLETRRGRPARIVLGDPLPEMVKLLPDPSDLAA